MMRALALAALASAHFVAAAWAQSPAPSPSPAATVDLQLVLAVDASGSVSNARFELQARGYAAAFRNPQLTNAIRSGMNQSIAVTMVQWTGPALQIDVIPWRLIKDAASAERFAAEIESAPRQLFGGGTSISGAIDHAVTLFPGAPYRGLRRTIDISGDGSNNRGRSVAQARDEAVAAGIVINGLPILELEPRLDSYYEANVIGGPGAFVIAASSYDTFAEAVLRKLIVEIASNDGAVWRGQPQNSESDPPTFAGRHSGALRSSEPGIHPR